MCLQLLFFYDPLNAYAAPLKYQSPSSLEPQLLLARLLLTRHRLLLL